MAFLTDQDNIPLPGQVATAPIREDITITLPITDDTNTTQGTIVIADAFITNVTMVLPSDQDTPAGGEYTIEGGALTITASAA